MESEIKEENEKVTNNEETRNGNEKIVESLIVSENLPSDETVSFKLVFNKQNFNVTLPLDCSIDDFKEHVQILTKVPVQMQKIMFKGRIKDNETLRSNNVVNGSKLMVIGSTIDDVLAVNQPTSSKVTEEAKKVESASKEPLCKMKIHKTILDKHGKPEDAMVGIKGSKDALPPIPISGMYDKTGGKVRLTFKLENDQVWIGTKARTEKISLSSIKSVISEPIEGHEEYHIMALQLGPTEASRYWIYWVPAQYVDSIKNTILGTWQFF